MRLSKIPSWLPILAIGMFEGDPAAGDPPKKFTQEEVNAIMKAEREKESKKLETIASTLELTEKQKKTLAEQLEAEKTAGMTKTEQLTRELEKTQKDLNAKAEAETQRAKGWEDRFKRELVATQLTNASAVHKAFNPDQVLAILRTNSRVVETLDSEQKPTGNFAVKIKIDTVDKEKKPITLDLDPNSAVKYLSETPEFANLFQGKNVPGLGGSNGSGNPSDVRIDVNKLSHEDYLKHREALMKQGGKKTA